MESFYSIIYYQPNSLTDELLAIGLLASGGEGPFIHVSRRRLDLLRKTIHSNQFVSVNRHFKNLARSVNADRKAPNELLLFDPNYSKERLQELSKATKGAVMYGNPVTINEWLNASFFDELVGQFMGDKHSEKTRKRPLFHLKWKAFYRSNKCKEWERDLEATELGEISLPVNLDLVDRKKKRIVKALDFDLNANNVNKKLYEVRLIAEAFNSFEVLIVHPGPRKVKGKELLKSIEDTVKNIKLEKFSSFKENS